MAVLCREWAEWLSLSRADSVRNLTGRLEAPKTIDLIVQEGIDKGADDAGVVTLPCKAVPILPQQRPPTPVNNAFGVLGIKRISAPRLISAEV
jgi:hypothetical protein